MAADGDECACLSVPFASLTLEAELGMDAALGEASLWRCTRCGRAWLRYLYELEGFTGSGRWYLGTIPRPDFATLDASRCRQTLETLDWYFFGGSYFDGRTGKASGPLA
jgi:hypothetical protein